MFCLRYLCPVQGSPSLAVVPSARWFSEHRRGRERSDRPDRGSARSGWTCEGLPSLKTRRSPSHALAAAETSLTTPSEDSSEATPTLPWEASRGGPHQLDS